MFLMEVLSFHVSDVSCTMRQTLFDTIVECQANNEIHTSVCMIGIDGNVFNCCKFDDSMNYVPYLTEY